jgi:hypothetical protein
MSRSVWLNGRLDLGKAYYKIYFATNTAPVLQNTPDQSETATPQETGSIPSPPHASGACVARLEEERKMEGSLSRSRFGKFWITPGAVRRTLAVSNMYATNQDLFLLRLTRPGFCDYYRCAGHFFTIPPSLQTVKEVVVVQTVQHYPDILEQEGVKGADFLDDMDVFLALLQINGCVYSQNVQQFSARCEEIPSSCYKSSTKK